MLTLKLTSIAALAKRCPVQRSFLKCSPVEWFELLHHCAAFLRCLLAARPPAEFWCRHVRAVVPSDLCRSQRAPGVLRGCFHCVELHACVGRHFGTRPPCRTRRFHLPQSRVAAPRLVCGCAAPPLRAGSSCTCFVSLCVFFFLPLSLCGSLPSLYWFQGVFELLITDGSSRVLCHRVEGFTA